VARSRYLDGMSPEDKRKRYQDVGAELIEQARQKAEAFLREVSNAGEATHQQAEAKVDGFFNVGRWGAEQIVETVRKEISAQLTSIGLATKADLDGLERKLTEAAAAARRSAARKAAATDEAPAGNQRSAAVPADGVETPDISESVPSPKAAAKRAAAKRAATKRMAAAKATTPPQAAAPAEEAVTKKAGIKKAVSKKPVANKAVAKKAPAKTVGATTTASGVRKSAGIKKAGGAKKAGGVKKASNR
jgi:hypothetical protein